MPALRHSCLFPIMAACLLLAPLRVSAANGAFDRHPASSFHGLYAGLASGLASFDVELDQAVGSADGLAATGIHSGIFLGSSTVYNRIFLAIEGNVAYHNADFSENIGANRIEADMEETYGLGGRIGGLLSQRVLAYVHGGWQEISIEASDATGWSGQRRFQGIRGGVGVEFQTDQNVFVRGEYSYTIYREGSLSSPDTEYALDPEVGTFQLGIGFRFQPPPLW